MKLDIRVVAATNQDMDRAVATGRFREDLYYRLKVLRISLPALREHPEDILPLARRFVARYVAESGRRLCNLSTAAEKILTNHH